MAAIDTITFDLWQTLIIDNRELGRARTQRRLDGALEALTDAGYEFDMDHLREAYRSCFRACRVIHQAEKDVTFDEQVNMFIDFIDQDLSRRLDGAVVERISYWYAESFFDFPPQVDPEARGALEELSGRGYRLGMISNTGMTPGRLFRRYLADHGLLDFFQALTFSDEVKLCKPSVEMFHMTLDALGTSPDRAVHLGDHIANDIHGGNRADMWTALLGAAEGQEKIATPHLAVGSLGEFPQTLETWLHSR